MWGLFVNIVILNFLPQIRNGIFVVRLEIVKNSIFYT